eukprot:4155971-Pleurochrysis_carterae.AAC.1
MFALPATRALDMFALPATRAFDMFALRATRAFNVFALRSTRLICASLGRLRRAGGAAGSATVSRCCSLRGRSGRSGVGARKGARGLARSDEL